MYYTYVMRCEDGSLYTGITTDVQRRFRQHRGEIAGGAKCTKGTDLWPLSVCGKVKAEATHLSWNTESKN